MVWKIWKLTFLLLLGACQGRAPLPQLLTILEIGPRTFDVGETVEVAGSGFPVKKTARLTFRGRLFRPGKAPETSWEFTAEGTAVNPYKIELPITETLRERFGGPTHATFRGVVEVAFEPLTPGSLPLTGTLADVVLDLVPAAHRRPADDALLADARQALQLLGVVLVADPHGDPASGLSVAEVAADSPAATAGLVPGDLLTSLDGLRLLDVRDLVPAGKRSYAILQATRANLPEPLELRVALHGFKGSHAPDLFGTALLLGIAATLLFARFSPLTRLLTWWEGGLPGGALGVAAAATADGSPRVFLPPKSLVLATSAACVALPFARGILAESLDAVTFFATGLAATALLGSATLAPSGLWSLRRAAAVAMRFVIVAIPAAVAIACLIALSGSFRLDDLVDAQGGAPWRWNVGRYPFAPALLLLFFAPVLITIDEPASHPALRGSLRESRPRSLAPWTLTLLLALLGAALFAGGWRVPAMEPETQNASFGAQLLGAILFLVKTGGFVVVASWIRTHVPLVRLSLLATSVFGRILLPSAFLSAAATWVWLAWDPEPFVRDVCNGITAGAVLLVALYAGRRLLTSSTAPPLRTHVSPFV